MGRRRSVEVEGEGGSLTATETKDGKYTVSLNTDGGGDITLTATAFEEFLADSRKEFFGGRQRQATPAQVVASGGDNPVLQAVAETPVAQGRKEAK